MAQRLRKSGLKPGMPDIMLFHAGGAFGIELKAGKNVLSPAQREMFSRLRDAGVPVYICRSVEDVVDVLQREKLPTRPVRGDDRWSLGPRRLPLERISGKPGDGVEAGGSDGTTQA
jgi:hypothetical protein